MAAIKQKTLLTRDFCHNYTITVVKNLVAGGREWYRGMAIYGIILLGRNIGGIVMRGKLLIVDDQKGVRRLLEELFKREGWEVDTAGDGLEALARVEARVPDLIIMDVKMPNMNGLEATQAILQENSDIPIILMTAYGEIEVVKQALEAGVKRCISKPFDIMGLRDIVDQLMMEIAS